MDFMDQAAKDRWAAETISLQKRRSQGFENALEELNSRGVLHSGFTLPTLFERGAASLREFADAWIVIYREFWQRAGPTSPAEISKRASENVKEWFHADARRMGDGIVMTLAQKGLGRDQQSVNQANSSLRPSIDAAVAACISEIESLRAQRENELDNERREEAWRERQHAETRRAWLVPAVTAVLTAVIVAWITSALNSRQEKQILAALEESRKAQQDMAKELANIKGIQRDQAVLTQKTPAQIDREIRRIQG